MFNKPYRIKAKTALKNSEKKHLVERLEQRYPHISHEKLKELVPTKSAADRLKIVLDNSTVVTAYSIDNFPLFFETDDKFFPTICALWKIPDLVPSITTANAVLSKLQNGAPLYLPGVIIPAQGKGFPQFSIGDVLAVNTEDNSAAFCVGLTLMSSGDMILKSGGSCLEPIHIIGDKLCKEAKVQKLERPKHETPLKREFDFIPETVQSVQELKISPPIKDDWPALGQPIQRHTPKQSTTPTQSTAPSVAQVCVREVTNEFTGDVEMSESIPDDMDGLLRFCLLSFLKNEGKKIVLPLKTNLLYRNHMLPMCPQDRTLDVKKSSYKKIGKFLESMENEGFIQVRELEKGVDAITAIDFNHKSIKEHRVPLELITQLEERRENDMSEKDEYTPPVIKEMFSITAAVLPLFAPYKKGETLSTTEIRHVITEYIRARDLQDGDNKSKIKIDLLLGQVTGKLGFCTWEQLMNGVIGKMTHCTELHFADGTVKTLKSKLDPIRMTVATRSGNKKVTLVSNLEAYGIDLPSLSKFCRSSISVSSTVTRTPGAKDDQLLVQGDQTHLLTKMLIEKFGMPKKYIEGADKNLSKKK